VTAAAPEIPPRLIMQLKRGGRMVVPVGEPFREQMLVLVTKDEDGEVHTKDVLPVAFVPLVPED
jgi:protein-L-isoaspartate(D-aspartate) O-methyltransferase